MGSTISETKVIGTTEAVEQVEMSEGTRSARSCMLDELPGLAAAIVTLAHIVQSFAGLVL
ncbi:MAG: hypothetical protein ACREQF_11775 [Candidatus Binataceae bacterium]